MAFRYPENGLGVHVCREVLAGLAYPLPWPLPGVRVVVDVGANVGAASVYFAGLFPEATVHAFEPDPGAFALLLENARDYWITPYPMALGSGSGEAVLYRGREGSVCSSLVKNPTTGDGACVPVKVRPAAEVLRNLNILKIDILKIDTEGMEVPILQSLSDFLPQVNLVYVEFHSEEDRREIDDLLLKSHCLVRAQVRGRDRGEMCYANRALIPEGCMEPAIDRLGRRTAAVGAT